MTTCRLPSQPPMDPVTGGCGLETLLGLISAKWTAPILYMLHRAGGPMRFGELRRAVTGIAQKELTRRLRELERLGMVERVAHAGVPLRVDYRLTAFGASLEDVFMALVAWVERHGAALAARAGTRPSAAAG